MATEISAPVLSDAVVTSHSWLMNTWDVARDTEWLNFTFYLLFIDLNGKWPQRLVVSVLDNIGTDQIG